MQGSYAILGAGRQGTAAAYALARFFDAREVVLLDQDPERARSAAARVDRLAGASIARGLGVDARDAQALGAALGGSGAVLSALPYPLNPLAARAALGARAHFTDLGGNTAVVLEELGLDPLARQAGVTLIPDAGLAPGLSNALGALALGRLPVTRDLRMWCGGLPACPRGPLGYQLVFHIGGLTNEYTGRAVCLRGGEVVELATLTEVERVRFPEPVGEAEAFLTSGGTSTCPWSWQGRLDTLEYKTVRYPGHAARIQPLVELGFLDLEPVGLGNGRSVVPRDLAHRILERHIDRSGDPDLVVLRVKARAPDGEELVFEMLDRADGATGFLAMERSTAFPAAALAHWQLVAAPEPGARSLELAIDPEAYYELVRRTGLPIAQAPLTP